MKITKFTYAIGLTVGFTLLSACGDEVTNVTTKTVIETVATFENLSKCENDNVGALAFVADSAKTYTCTENGWVSTDGIDGKDGEDGKDGADGKDGTNGKKGTKGANGSKGKDGIACIAKELSSGKGYKIVCDGDSVGVVLNGQDGPEGKKGEKGDNGKPGDTGEGCEMSPRPNGTYLVTCSNASAEIYEITPTPIIPTPNDSTSIGPTPSDSTSIGPTPSDSTPVATDDPDCAGPRLWCKAESKNYNYRVQTGLDAGYDDSGYWFSYTDDADGGKSKITWPVKLGNEYDEYAFDPVIEHCQGLCGTVTLDKGALDRNPFAGVGFNLAGTSDGSTLVASTIVEWNSICITYTSDLPGILAIGVGDSLNQALRYDLPHVNLPTAATPDEKCFVWTDFRQTGNAGGAAISGPEAAARAVSFYIEFSSNDGDSGDFNIISMRKN